MGSLIPKLGELLMDEYNLHKSIKKDIEFLRKELQSMHAALTKVGDVPRDQLDKQVKLWADEVRDLSYDMEDVIDKFVVRVDGIEPHENTNRFSGLMEKMVGLFKKGKNHHRIADAIKEIKEQLHEVAARRDRNKVDGIAPNPTEAIAIDPRLRALYTEAAELVGIYGKRDHDLMSLLSMEGDDISNKRIKKISIVGFGGLGKTTLARAVYEKIKGALPRAEQVYFSLGVRVAIEDGNCGFDLGLQGNLLSLRRDVIVWMYCGGVKVGEAKQAEAVVRRALDAHPNHPKIYIDMLPYIADGTQVPSN
ncbi:unnamed protein product [Triticum turgidum subsp. durum]|uniref:Rx N-terminal domain-containing protein n=1 Tax=Triticum turgidum subsp. durum TaxID=4567 RepID=A0A9R0QMQ4_TRITD|nr:unnamed protein product [Triticum turgidum subsp. durum]